MTHLSPSFWVHTTSKCSDKSSCSQTKVPCEKLCFCFEMKTLPFSGILSEVRSIVEITKGVQSKILDHKLLKLWTYPSPHRSWYISIVHRVITSRVYCFFGFLFIQILIDHYPLSKEKFNKYSSGSHFEYSLIPVTAQPDWFMCIPLGQRKKFVQFYTSFHLICNSPRYSGMWENM